MARSYGSAASLLALKEVTYGVKPTGNWEKFAFVSSDLSAEQNLLSSELLGQGREPRAPFRDVINDTGNFVRRTIFQTIRAMSRQQFVKQHSETINIRSRRNFAAADLFRRSIFRRHHPHLRRGRINRHIRNIRVKQFSDPEIQQFRRSVGFDDDV